MPQFVLLEHDHPHLHWDFMVESGESLRTWRLDCIPDQAAELIALALPDHRKAYLDYEGPVSRNRGTVRRIDRGSCNVLDSGPDHLSLELHGERLIGQAVLRRISSNESAAEPLTNGLEWRMMWSPDSTDTAAD